MKVNIKTLQGKSHTFDVEPDLTVIGLKTMICEAIGTNVDSQKLIAAGKVLDNDERTIGDYKLKDNVQIVCMVAKAKPAPQAAPQQQAQQTASTMPQPGVSLPANPSTQSDEDLIAAAVSAIPKA